MLIVRFTCFILGVYEVMFFLPAKLCWGIAEGSECIVVTSPPCESPDGLFRKHSYRIQVVCFSSWTEVF